MGPHDDQIRGQLWPSAGGSPSGWRGLGGDVVKRDANRRLGREKSRELGECPIALDGLEAEGTRAFRPVGQGRHRTRHGQDVQHREIGAIAAGDPDRAVEGVAREVGKIDRTKNVLDVNHDDLQSCYRAATRLAISV